MFTQQPMLPAPMKKLLIGLLVVFIVTHLLMKMGIPVDIYLGLVPALGAGKLFLWQFVTYGFLHGGLMHLILNGLILWMLGTQLMYIWGTKEFFKYCLICVVGGGVTNVLSTYFLVPMLWGAQAQQDALFVPMVGASGAVYGLLAAFAIFFGEQTMLVLFLFPMKAKWVALMLGFISLWEMLLESPGGPGTKIAHAAHLGGMVTGFLYLYFKTKRKMGAKASVLKERENQKARFRVIVNQNFNEKDDNDSDPSRWN